MCHAKEVFKVGFMVPKILMGRTISSVIMLEFFHYTLNYSN